MYTGRKRGGEVVNYWQHHLPQRPNIEKAKQHEEETRITLKNRLGSRMEEGHKHTCGRKTTTLVPSYFTFYH